MGHSSLVDCSDGQVTSGITTNCGQDANQVSHERLGDVGIPEGAPCQAARHCAAASNATGCRSAATGTRSRAARFSILRQGARCYRSGTLCFLVIKDAIMTIPASIINTVTNNLAWHTRAIHTPAILMPPTATTAIVKTPPRPRPEPTTRKLSPPPSRRCEPNGARPCVLRRPSPCMLRETTYPL
jgi:hypothetical protein